MQPSTPTDSAPNWKKFASTIDPRAAPLVLSMWPCNKKLDEEKAQPASLAQQNGFSPVLLQDVEADKRHCKA